MDLSCCLCCETLPEDHRKRKKFHGHSCNEARAVAARMSPVPLNSIPETSNPTAVLCFRCEKKLNDINSLEVKLSSLKADVSDMLSQLITNVSTQPSLGKHGLSTSDNSEQPHSQRPHLDPSVQQSSVQSLIPVSYTSTVDLTQSVLS